MHRLAEEADYGNYHVYYLYSYKPFIILCMQFAYTHAYKYENGMYLNVHIPSSHKEDAEVTEIVTTGKRKMKHFQIANVIISIAICFIVLLTLPFCSGIYCLDVCIYIWNHSYSKQLPPENVCSEKQNGWIIEAQRKRFISTPAFQQKPVPRQSAINGTHSFNY